MRRRGILVLSSPHRRRPARQAGRHRLLLRRPAEGQRGGELAADRDRHRFVVGVHRACRLQPQGNPSAAPTSSSPAARRAHDLKVCRLASGASALRQRQRVHRCLKGAMRSLIASRKPVTASLGNRDAAKIAFARSACRSLKPPSGAWLQRGDLLAQPGPWQGSAKISGSVVPVKRASSIARPNLRSRSQATRSSLTLLVRNAL
jgi:hypothetical protein